eukprot:6492744-Amphidinium_carterae.2
MDWSLFDSGRGERSCQDQHRAKICGDLLWIHEADRDNSQDISALDFANENRSPACFLITELCQLLDNEAAQAWCIFSKGVWSQGKRNMAFVQLWRLVGHIFLRCVLPFRGWPWRLAGLVTDMKSEYGKHCLSREFHALRPCCLDAGFSAKIRAAAAEADSLLEDRLQHVILTALSSCPVNNIGVEARFGRTRLFSSSVSGNAEEASTLSSNHVLAELTKLHSDALRSEGVNEEHVVADKKERWRAISPWNVYVQDHRARLKAKTITMQELSELYHKLPPDQFRALQMQAAAQQSNLLQKSTEVQDYGTRLSVASVSGLQKIKVQNTHTA